VSVGGRNDMQRINGLRIEEESRRKDEETEARLRPTNFDAPSRPSRLNAALNKSGAPSDADARRHRH